MNKGVMVRLLLVLAPAVCIMAAIGISELIKFFAKSLRGTVEYFMIIEVTSLGRKK